MRSVPSLFVAGCTLMLSPLAVAAQVCLGAPSFTRNHLQLAAAAEFADAGTRAAATWTAGSNSYFGGLGVGTLTYDNISGSAFLAQGRVGSQIPLQRDGGLQVCPVLTAEFGFGPRDIDVAGTDLSSQLFDVGIHLGGRLGSGAGLALIPTVGVGLAHAAVRRDAGSGAVTDTDTYGTVSAGLGLLLGDALVVRPSVQLPVRSADNDLRVGILVAFNYGGRR